MIQWGKSWNIKNAVNYTKDEDTELAALWPCLHLSKLLNNLSILYSFVEAFHSCTVRSIQIIVIQLFYMSAIILFIGSK
jgi:hypothetical protein